MSVIYSTKDRIKVGVDGLVVTISPLTAKTKSDINAKIVQGNVMDAACLALKHAIKDIDGVKRVDGSEYKLEFEDNILSDNSVDDLLNLQCGPKINLIAIELINGVPQKFLDSATGNALDGVEFIKTEKRKRKK